MAESARARRRVFLVRHGEVSYFADDGRPYRPDTVPLNEEGRTQALALAELLGSVPLDRVISSTLRRSVETAEVLAAARGLAVQTYEDLREIRPGRLADIPPDTIQQAFVGAFSGDLGRDSRFLGGETFGSLEDRVLACFDRLLAEDNWRTALVVAHGGVNRTILARALGTGLNGFARLEQDACCVNIIDVAAEGYYLVRLVNYTPYNPAKTGLELTTMERLYAQYRRRRDLGG